MNKGESNTFFIFWITDKTDITWYKGKISEETEIKIDGVKYETGTDIWHYLTINNVQKDDKCRYYCKIKDNPITISTYLNVFGKFFIYLRIC